MREVGQARQARDFSAWVELHTQAEKGRVNNHKIVYLPIQKEMSKEEKIFRKIDSFLEHIRLGQVVLGLTFLYLLYHIFLNK